MLQITPSRTVQAHSGVKDEVAHSDCTQLIPVAGPSGTITKSLGGALVGDAVEMATLLLHGVQDCSTCLSSLQDFFFSTELLRMSLSSLYRQANKSYNFGGQYYR